MSMVVFLQNAWSPVFAGHKWPRKSWLRALQKSRTGIRLRVMIDDLDLCEETTEEVAAEPSGICPPDIAHIQRVLNARQPQIVVACGKQAENIVGQLWRGPLLVVPHPAHRLVTDALFREARRLLSQDFSARLALRQLNGSIKTELIK